MIWMMIPCLLLIVVTLFGGEKLASFNYFWLIILGVCIVPHIWMMFKGHGEHDNNGTENKISNISTTGQSETKNENKENKRGRCCH